MGGAERGYVLPATNAMRLGELGRVASLLAAAVLLSTACGEGPGPESPDERVAEEERYGGSAVVGGRGEIPTLNPLLTTDYVAQQLLQFAVSVPLVRYDSLLRPRPHLAESWEVDAESTSVVIRLREGASWHDGEPVTAEDLAFTFRLAKDPRVPFPNREYFAGWDSVEVVDDRTVRFRIRPRAHLMFGWSRVALLPRHLLAGVSPEELVSHPYGTTEFTGYGPFRLAEHEPGERWVFEAVPDHPAALGGRPYLDTLVYRVLPEETTLLAELRAGRVHHVLDAPPAQAARARDDPALRILSTPFPAYTMIVWNGKRPHFAEATVRRALTLAIDRRALLEAGRRGFGTLASGPIGPWHWAHDPAWRPLPHAPDSARALLDRAGWRDRDGDGVREKEGVSFRFELATNPSREREDMTVMVQADLAEVGVEARPRTREYASLGAALTSPDRPFDAVVIGWNQDLVLDDRDLWSCERPDSPYRFASYCNPALDAVLDSIARASDREERRRLYRRYHEIVHRDQPYTFLFFERRADFVRRELRGVRVEERGELVSVDEWWLLPGSRGGS